MPKKKTPYARLVSLAEDSGFSENAFSEAEKKLFGSVANGLEVDCAGDPEKDRLIRAELIEWLLSNRAAKEHLHYRGVRLRNARFDEGFDISRAEVGVPLALESCQFGRGVVLDGTRIKRFSLWGGSINKRDREHAIDLSGMVSDGPVAIGGGLEAIGEVRLVDLHLEGVLNLSGAKITNAGGTAVGGDRVHATGGVFCREGFIAVGNVIFRGAVVGGHLHMDGATITVSSGEALVANSILVNRSVLLGGGFEANGAVNLQLATINGDLMISDAVIGAPRKKAIDGTRANIKANCVFVDSKIDGRVDFARATIGNSLRFESTSCRSPASAGEHKDVYSDNALRFTGATVGGAFGLLNYDLNDPEERRQSVARINGVINLRGAEAAMLEDCEQNWFDSDGQQTGAVPALDGFTYRAIGRHSPKSASFRKRMLALGELTGGEFAPQPYTQLAKVLREMGHPQWATKVLVERQRRQLRKLDDTKIRKRLRQVFSELLLGHGYRPWRAVIPLLVFLVIGWATFYVGWMLEKFNPVTPLVYASYAADDDTGPTPEGWPFPEKRRFPGPYTELDKDLPQYPAFVSFVYAIDTLLPIVNLHQETFWMPTGWFRVYLWVHIAAGWVFTTLLVAGLTGVVRRPAE